jgi:hypothetical protein
MPVSYGLFAGTTTFSGASISEVLEYLRECHGSTLSTIKALKGLHQRFREELSDPAEITRLDSFSERIICNLTDTAANLHRLVTEIPGGVLPAHVELVEQMYADADRYETAAVRIRDDLRYDPALPSEEANWFLERIFSVGREQFVDHQDLPNLAVRLRTFVGTPSGESSVSGQALGMLELKPNIFGLGVNLNAIFGWVGSRLRRQ